MLAALEARVSVMLSCWPASLTWYMSGPEVFLSHPCPDPCSEGRGQEEDVLQTSLGVAWRKSISSRVKGKAGVYSKDLAPLPQQVSDLFPPPAPVSLQKTVGRCSEGARVHASPGKDVLGQGDCSS